MKNDASNNNLNPEEEKELFAQLKVSYAKSKEEVWQALEANMAQTSSIKTLKQSSSYRLNRVYLSIAASLILFISIGLFARLYQKYIQVAKGELSEHLLPDGSKVFLNADSHLSYAPYWWSFNRTVYLEGEAFFEVKKGKKFKVQTDLGRIEVLGTQFNVYTREREFQVYCTEGKVAVSSPNKQKIVLQAEDYAVLESNQLSKLKAKEQEKAILSWRTGQFIYNTTPLKKVFQDFERYYDVKIQLKIKNINSLYYTGLFKRAVTIEEALQIVCLSFDLSFEMNKKGIFSIRSN